MTSIIEELYECFADQGKPDGPERKKAAEEYYRMCDLVQETYGADFVDRLAELKEQLLGDQGFWSFSAGFRAGARLMLEVLTSATV